MNLSELITKYGDDKVVFQKIDDCATNFATTKHGSKITFVTSETFGFNGMDKLGLVIWLDRERVTDIIEQDRKEKTK